MSDRETTSQQDPPILEELLERVLIYRPVLKNVLDTYGHLTLAEYAATHLQHLPQQSLPERKGEFVDAFKREAARMYGESIAENAAEQLERYPVVSTADHHGPLCDPNLVSSNMALALATASTPDFQNIIVLATGNTSLNNATFPGGLSVNRVPLDGTLQKINLFPAKIIGSTTHNLPGYTPAQFQQAKERLKNQTTTGVINPDTAQGVEKILDTYFGHSRMWEEKSYRDQVSKVNAHLWQDMTGQNSGRLIYVPLESVAGPLIRDHHLNDRTIISRMLFDPKSQEYIEKFFEGIACGFSKKEKTGTYLFWALPAGHSHRVSLWKNGNYLVSEDGAYSVELTPSALHRALENEEIIPSILLSLVMQAFYYKITCLGGTHQINYLRDMQEAYEKFLDAMGETDEKNLLVDVDPSRLTLYRFVFLKKDKGELWPATGADLLLYKDEGSWERHLYTARHLTVRDAIYLFLPRLYAGTHKGDNRDPKLASITSADIITLAQMEEKIKPWAVIT